MSEFVCGGFNCPCNDHQPCPDRGCAHALLEPAPGLDLDAIIAGFGAPSSVHGVEKDQADLDRYAQIIETTVPEVIVETGTRRGFSANWFAEQLGVERVLTIDNDPGQIVAPAKPGVIRLVGESRDPDILDDVWRLTVGRRTMVSLDSDHSRVHVATEIELYASFVTPGCYLVIEDGVYHFHNSHEYDGDPLQAISAIMPSRTDFVRDLTIEGRFPVTGAIAGWWRKVER